MAQRNARSRSESADPSGVRSVLNRNQEIASSKSTAGSAHSAGPAPNLHHRAPSHLKFEIRLDFRSTFFRLKNRINFWLSPKHSNISKQLSRNGFGSLFDDFVLILSEFSRFVDPFKIEWAPKWDPKSTKWHKHVEN